MSEGNLLLNLAKLILLGLPEDRLKELAAMAYKRQTGESWDKDAYMASVVAAA